MTRRHVSRRTLSHAPQARRPDATLLERLHKACCRPHSRVLTLSAFFQTPFSKRLHHRFYPILSIPVPVPFFSYICTRAHTFVPNSTYSPYFYKHLHSPHPCLSSFSPCPESWPNNSTTGINSWSSLDLSLRFRLGKHAFVSDIEKAFLQIQTEPNDRDALRFY